MDEKSIELLKAARAKDKELAMTSLLARTSVLTCKFDEAAVAFDRCSVLSREIAKLKRDFIDLRSGTSN